MGQQAESSLTTWQLPKNSLGSRVAQDKCLATVNPSILPCGTPPAAKNRPKALTYHGGGKYNRANPLFILHTLKKRNY